MTASDPSRPGPSGDPPPPLERLLDVAVYGPVGLALAARDLLPQWAEMGRRQLDAQFRAARAVGRLVVGQGTRQAGQTIRRLAGQSGAVLRGAGVSGADPDRRDTEETVAPGGPHADPAGDEPTGWGEDTASIALVPDVVEPAASALDPAELAIPGYDTLSASQVVQRLPGLSPEELEAVRTYELAGRARKTILLKVAQLKPAS